MLGDQGNPANEEHSIVAHAESTDDSSAAVTVRGKCLGPHGAYSKSSTRLVPSTSASRHLPSMSSQASLTVSRPLHRC